jgi:LmbE family N-acetylglucosaminyl deacetylase
MSDSRNDAADVAARRETATPSSALIVVAHPDDADFLVAGSAAKWAREGCEVRLVVVTDGSKGSDDPEMLPEKLIKLRQDEQRAAARVLGTKEVIFLGYEDGALADSPRLRRDLTRVGVDEEQSHRRRG